jgi:glycosyltransferase involved in cell wall biosynthesis
MAVTDASAVLEFCASVEKDRIAFLPEIWKFEYRLDPLPSYNSRTNSFNQITVRVVFGSISFKIATKNRYCHLFYCSLIDLLLMTRVSQSQPRPLKILSFTSLYPNAEQPRHGIFVENRLKELKKSHPVEITVIAPVPWFPLRSARFGHYATFARIESKEERSGITVYHPRYAVIPKIGMNVAALMMFASLYFWIRRLHARHQFDLIDGHFLYPDGVAATLIGRALGLPVMNTARGSDVLLYTQYAIPRRQIRWAVKNNQATIAVCKFLADELKELEPSQGSIVVMRNGVDLELFREQDREATRGRLHLNRFTLLSVGNLIELKGHHLIIEAMQTLTDCELLIAGEGPMGSELEQMIKRLGLGDRIRLLGLVPHNELQQLYSAADCLVLASRSEGWANVLLESMACGTPVAATRVSGTPEVVQNKSAGVLLDQRTPEAIIEGIRELQQNYPQRTAVRHYASAFSWQETSDSLYALAAELASSPTSASP